MRFSGRYRTVIFFVTGLLAVGVHGMLLMWPAALDDINLKTLESSYANRAFVEQALRGGRRFEKIEDIAILAFDHTFSAEQYGDLIESEPALAILAKQRGTGYDRALYAMILDKLMNAGARLVVFDFWFEGRGSAGGDAGDAGDRQFAEALARWRNHVVIGSLVQESDRVVSVREPNEALLENVPEEDIDGMIGFVTVWKDAHGCVSQSVLSANRLALGNPALGERNLKPDVFSLASRAAAKLGKPLPAECRVASANFAGPAGTFPAVPVHCIFTANDWEKRLSGGAYFKDKIVIVGPYSEIHYKDDFRTPIGGMLGVEIQANFLNNALRDNWLKEIFPGKRAIVWTGILVLCVWALFSSPRPGKSRPARLVVFSAMLVAGLFLLQEIFFCAYGRVLPGFSLSVTTGLIVVFLSMDFIRTHYERSRIHNLFGNYLPAEVVRKMVEKGDDPVLGGENVVLTSLFCDVQAFSTFSEQLSPGELVELMNELFGAMTTLLESHEGTLDKYAGDAIIAMFGAPLPMPDHAERACRCALAMQARLGELRRRWTQRQSRLPATIRAMRMRIGINTGPAVVGNMGSARRFNYTMMGDTVNLAARCESGAKDAGVFTLVTEATKAAIADAEKKFVFRKIDLWRVKGRQTPAAIYELVGAREELKPATAACLKTYAEGLALYFDRQWEAARAKFAESAASELFRPDAETGVVANPSTIMAARCNEFLDTPPPEDWDGVYAPKEIR